MVMHIDGDWHVGDTPADIDEFLREVGADGYEAHEIRHCVCRGCGADVFGVCGEPDEGTMRRPCHSCGGEDFVAGSDEYWSDEDLQIMVYVGEEEDFNIAVGYSLYADGDGIRSLATAERCIACGKIGSFTNWMVRGCKMELLDLAQADGLVGSAGDTLAHQQLCEHGPVTATFDDYLWFEQLFPDLSEAYCITLVQDVTPAGLLDRFGVVGDRVDRIGVSALVEPSYAMWETHDGDVQLVAAAAVGDWALAVESNGYLGVTEELLGRLSAGTRLVSHFRNVNAVDRFYLVDDGRIHLDFEPLFAWHRSGCDADGYVDLMHAVGLPMEQDGDIGDPSAAAFALAEAITGIQLTSDLLQQATFTCGEAYLPGRTRA